MSKRLKYVIWSAVILIDFLLINVGLEGWFMGFAYGTFKSKLKELFLDNYFESFIIPILLVVFTYIFFSLRINVQSVVDKLKLTSTVSLFIFIIVFQSVYFFISLDQIITTNKKIESVYDSINEDSFLSTSILIDERSVKERLNKIDKALKTIKSKVDDLEIEIQYLHR